MGVTRGRLRTAALGAGLLLAVTASACPRRDHSLDRLRDAGAIRIGYAIEAPYAFLAADGHVTGESPEIARHVAVRLGLPRIDWQLLEFGGLIDALEAGHIDAIAAGMFVTPARAQRVSFSRSTFRVRGGFLVARGNPLHLGSYASAAANPRARFAVVTGSVEADLLARLGVPRDRLVEVPDGETGRDAVGSGWADALALSAPTVRYMALHDELGATEPVIPAATPGDPTIGNGAFAFRKADRQLLDSWNHVLEGYVGSPEHLRLVQQFGFTAADIPGPAAAESR